ncbi:semaphorin-1A isoform X1 [Anastrepha ludens]|uniref:semaphorin-1A isoform X1 n=1 Tax=Anastrepha ludens TaxID=28586 RepID=UPI0023B06560|nr:semaphorin-1A isoform X1 [Anastrepha ludens]XP_053967129.1 semaphorin-1A isoform X1 [Anastrepha ludens]
MQKQMQKRTTKSVFAIKTLISCGTLCLLLVLPHAVHAWMPDVRPDLQPKQDKIIAKFLGNSTDYFKILASDDATILVGAKDVMYNISLDGLREISRLEWFSSDADRELCALKGKRETDCHNYIRVFSRLDEAQILLCGTNSYKPRCRHYAPATSELSAAAGSGQRYEIVRDVEAQGLCPYSPAHNSTYAFAEGQLYSATVADFSGSDPLIYRENLRTEQYDLKQLNQPDFVGAVERDRYVMFFFREISMEYMNFGKTIYSRVARVCKNDRGGPYTLSKSWTSFLKARLNCSVPGEFPFYFDEIQAITPIVESGANPLIYAVFTTSVNAIPGSAVCAFNVNDIMDAFEGSFKSQKDSQSQWLPIQDEQVPEPRPGKCVEDSRMLSSIAVNFAKTHPLMETAVPAVYGRPLLTKVNLHHRLTTIAIDAQIVALNGEYYDVIYSGTDDGRITKFINIPTPSQTGTSASVDKLKTVLISEMQVLPLGVPVRELVVSSKSNRLLVVSDGSLVTVPLHHCAHIVDCLGCLSLQDPNCAWDQQNHECKSLSAKNIKFGTKAFLQSLNTTKKAAASLCPKFTRGTLMADGPNIGGGVVASPGIDLVTAQQPQADEDMSKKFHYSKVGVTAGNAAATSGSTTVPESSVPAVEVPTGRGGDLDASTGAGNDYLLNSFSDENKITLHSVDPDELMNTLSGEWQDPLHSQASVNEKKLKVAGKSLYWALALIAFVVGIIVGHYTSKRVCKTTSLHASHRNQFTSNSQFGVKHHNTGKDINLLMNPNHFCNQKKPNLDLEKDRSHECKNSTENLEKEIPCKTSTLTKVKRTYI